MRLMLDTALDPSSLCPTRETDWIPWTLADGHLVGFDSDPQIAAADSPAAECLDKPDYSSAVRTHFEVKVAAASVSDGRDADRVGQWISVLRRTGPVSMQKAAVKTSFSILTLVS